MATTGRDLGGGPTTRLRADAAANRERIVAAGAALFAVHGLDVPMDEVARRAGVGKGTLYRRFPDREELFAAVAADTFARLDALAVHVADTEPDPWIRLCRYLREWLTLSLGVVYEALCADLPTMLEARPEVRAARETWLTRLEWLTAEAQGAGRLREDVRAGDIALFMNVLQRSRNGQPLLRQSAERFLEIMLDGLSVHRDVPLPGIPLGIPALRASTRRHD
ncbi:MAG: TetR/AcrR family transcriptional regulator [Microbacterium sp.]